MTFDEYQKLAARTDIMGDGSARNAHDPAYIAKILGLSGEAGEVSEKYKKIIRDKGGVINQADKDEIIKELGDVLWYVAILARYLGVNFEEIASRNIDKLSSRHKRGAIKGKSDNR